MGGGNCLICYSLIPNSNTFNSLKNPQNICISFCKLLQLPVESFKGILSGSPTCQDCTKGLQEGAEVIARFEELQKELNQLRTTFQNKLKNGHKLSLDDNNKGTGDLSARHEERTLIINELKLGGEDADTSNEFQDDYSPFVLVNTDSPESSGIVDPDSDHQEEIHMSRIEISSLPEIKLFENEDLAAPESQNMTLEGLSSMPSIPGKKQRKSNRIWIVKPESNLSNCIMLKVPRIQLVKLPLPRGQTAFKLKDLPSFEFNPLQNPPKPALNLPEPTFKHKFACTLCFKVCISPDTFYVHSNYFNHTLKTFQCCSEQFSTVALLNQHRKLVHDEVVRKLNVTRNPKRPKRPYQCDKCGLRCNGRVSLQDHINAVHLQLRPFTCTWPGCQESFKAKKRLKEHVNEFHKNYRPFLCELCPKTFVNFGKLNSHRKGVHEKSQMRGVFRCEQCQSILQHKSSLLSHMKRVHNPVRHLCTICGYELKTMDSLRDHIKLHKKKGDKFRPRNRSCWKKEPQKPKLE